MAYLGGPDLGFLMRRSSTCHPGLCHLKACLSVEDPLPRWWTHVAGKLVPVPDRRPQFLPRCGLSIGCLNIVITWQLSSPDEAKRDRQRRKQHCILNQLWKSHTICHSLFFRSKSPIDSGPHWRERELDSTFWRNECQSNCERILKPLEPLSVSLVSVDWSP